MEPIILLVGSLLGFFSLYNSPPLHSPSDKDLQRWESSFLSSETLSSELNNEYCYYNQRNFLACANALDNMAYYLGAKFIPPGKLVIDLDGGYNEKNRLKPWVAFYKKNSTVNFKEKADTLIFKKIPLGSHKFITAMGINGLLSVAFDPHTYLKPEDEENILEDSTFQQNHEAPLVSTYKEKKVVFVQTVVPENAWEISLKEFSRGSCSQLRKTLEEANLKNVQKVILDLSNNPGGFVDEASCIGALFLGKKHIVTLINFNQKKEVYMGPLEQVYFNELKVLVDNNSASSSEILAGAILHYNRGEVEGESTYGKGTFQKAIKSKWSKLNVNLMKTSGYFFTPDGFCPQMVGLTPSKLTKKLPPQEDELFLFPKPNPESK